MITSVYCNFNVPSHREMKLQSNLLAEYGLVSGLWNTAFSIGDILGPTLGGVMVVKFEFSNSLAILGVVLFVLVSIKLLSSIIPLISKPCPYINYPGINLN